MIRTESHRAHGDSEVRAPTVLAVLVVKDGVRWLRDCLQGLSSQSYPRLGILAVDNGSTDGSLELLERALGVGRVRRLDVDQGVAGAVSAALDMPAAKEAEYLLVVHDDTALEPETVTRLVDAAESIQGTGVVGPKVVDWEDPRILREVGRSTDRFGHPYTPLQDGEFDHGQYDRVLEVLFVSSCAMLVRREVWQRAGTLDERLASHHEDLDFCWRARLAGFRVVMTPLARVRHYAAAVKGLRAEPSSLGERYYGERASLASMLKNYGPASIAWLLPLYFLIGLLRLTLLAFSRRFEGAWELLAAWGWNLRHLPGTLRRRVSVQKARTVKDRDIGRFMESASPRLPRWLDEASRIVVEQQAIDEEGPAGSRLRAHTRSLIVAHPVLVGVALAIVVGSFTVAPVVGAEPLTGGALARFPGSAEGFLHELLSGVRTTALGGAQAGSPALGAMGGLSWLLFDGASLAQRVFVVALPAIGAAMVYRAVGRMTGERLGATVAAGCFGLSALVLWAFSEGRIDYLVSLAVLPVVAERLSAAFGKDRGQGWFRLAAGVGVALAIGVAFFPGTVLPAAVVLAVLTLTGRARGRGVGVSAVGIAIAAALVFPMLPDLIGHPGPTISSLIGGVSFGPIVRSVLGPGPGSWAVAWFLPAGALLSLVVVRREHRAAANRMAILALAGMFLAWGSAAGYLPDAVSNQMAYVALAVVAEAFLVGFGVASVASVASGLGGEAFGVRQITAGALTFVLALGLALQAFGAITGDKAVGEDALPPAWPVVASAGPDDFHVLWLGRRSGERFPAPGGDPKGIVEAGSSSVRYSLTGRDGVTALDTGRGQYGGGYDALEAALTEMLSGSTRYTGALLAPGGVRYIVAEAGDLPPPVVERLGEQLDLDLVPALGLTIYRNARPLPTSSLVRADDAFLAAAAGGEPERVAALRRPPTQTLEPIPGGWSGDAAGIQRGYVLIADQFAPAWRLASAEGTADPETAFGWATGFRVSHGTGAFSIRYDAQWAATVQTIVLGLLWIAALWVTRRPVSS